MRLTLHSGFDQQMAEKVAAYMGSEGVKFQRDSIPTKAMQRKPLHSLLTTCSWRSRRMAACWSHSTRPTAPSRTPGTRCVRCCACAAGHHCTQVVFAIGRDPCTKEIGLSNAGVALDPRYG